jgi:hypothetical protein
MNQNANIIDVFEVKPATIEDVRLILSFIKELAV